MRAPGHFGFFDPFLRHDARGVSRAERKRHLQTAPRVVGRVFYALGLIEQWRSGIQRMTGTWREAGLANLRLEKIASRSRVTIYTRQVNRPALDDTDQTLVESLADGSGRPMSAIAAIIGLGSTATRTRLAGLVGSGLLREVCTGPQDPQRRYFSARPHH